MKVQSGEVPRAPPGGDGAGDADLRVRAPSPGAAWVGAWSLAEAVRREAHRWHVGASSMR